MRFQWLLMKFESIIYQLIWFSFLQHREHASVEECLDTWKSTYAQAVGGERGTCTFEQLHEAQRLDLLEVVPCVD